MAKYFFHILIPFALLISCSNKKTNDIRISRDTTINPGNSFSELFLDSTFVEKFIELQEFDDSTVNRLRNFYNSRNYQFAWLTEEGLAEQAYAFWNLHNNYINYSKDSSFIDKSLHHKMESLTNDDTVVNASVAEKAELELQLTLHFFQYAQYAYAGKVDPSKLQWHISRKKINPSSLLDSLINTQGKNIEEWEPVSRQYKLMKEQLVNYYDFEKNNWKEIVITKKTYKRGDDEMVIGQVKERLRSLGDYTQNDTSSEFTAGFADAVKRAQKRFGRKQNGIIDTELVKELNVPAKERIEQILVNMERMRWMPKEPEGNRLLVNIPEYKLHVYENGKEAFNMDIVVGKAGTNTVIFNDQLKHIVFSPYWNIPRSIVRNEILPAMNGSANYLEKRNMEQTGYSNGLPLIRQKPGKSNALGRVKFLFPNSYAIYFHDTPSKSLFNRESRAFSHGCIRLSAPKKLAEYLLRDKPEWTSIKITEAMYAEKEKWVTLEKPVPVFISYFTAWVDNEGVLNFRDDIYGHDKRMARRLFGHYDK